MSIERKARVAAAKATKATKGASTVTKCTMSDEIVFDFVEGELDSTLREDFKLHLEGCSECQVSVAELRWLKKNVKAPGISLPDERVFNALHDKIMANLDKKAGDRGGASVVDLWRKRILAPAAAAAAAIVLAFVAQYKTSSFQNSYTASLDRQSNLEEQFLVQTASSNPENFETIIGSQDTDDVVMSAAAEKLSRMSDSDVRQALDSMR